MKPQPRKFTHKLVAKTAMEIAGEAYDQMAEDDVWYKAHPDAKHYVATNWHKYIEAARGALTMVLTCHTTPEDQKEIIYDALCADHSLRFPAAHQRPH